MRWMLRAGLPVAVWLMAIAICRAVTVPATVALEPGTSRVTIRTYGLGLLPFDGQFQQFHGTLRYAAGDHGRCSVTLQVAVASLSMGTQAMTATALGPDFLNAAHYPTLSYAGSCDGRGVNGQLTMHGVTRPLTLSLDWRREGVRAVGRLRRAEWGMTARPLLGGKTVRITVSVPLPQPTG